MVSVSGRGVSCIAFVMDVLGLWGLGECGVLPWCDYVCIGEGSGY